ncbi:MMPL family transporter [Longispora sp. NPDC051575]|uniref:MMPL family transporter n=1 Tax=Longispora sp. NPDC051575 TaxID=3154943 RepID=UPI00341B3B73
MSKSRYAFGVAALVVLGWFVAAGVLGPLSGKLSEVQTNDNAAFLPASAEATRAQQQAAAFTGTPTTPAVVVFERRGGLTEPDRTAIAAVVARLPQVAGVGGAVFASESDDKEAVQVFVPVTAGSQKVGPTVEALRELARAGAPPGLVVHVAGPAGLVADLVGVFGGIDVQLLLVTAGVVLVILLVVYRSPVLWIIPMASVGVAYAAAAAVVYALAKNDVVDLNGQAQGILTVLVFGAGTDYALLLIARYREELRRHDRPVDAMLAALRGAAPAIVASALTVAASMLCLLVSDLNSNRALGPVGAAGVLAALVVMLTLLPALLLLGGRWAFWPLVPRPGQPGDDHPWWTRIAGFVGRNARLAWIVPTLLLLVLAGGLFRLDAGGVPQSESFTKTVDSVEGQQAIGRHFPAGAGSPAVVIARAPALDAVVAAAKVPGVAAVVPYPSRPGAPGAPAAPPKVVDGLVRIDATLTDPADGDAAAETVRRLREAVHAVPGASAVVGGFTAVQLDTRAASRRDLTVIIPLVLALITLILALLLRSLLAPLLLIGTVVLSFVATLGLCTLLFEYVFGFAGADTSFPLFAFVFLIALGIDYNIFLMSRVREESGRHGTREGTLRGLAVTGGVITSAGVVLAATFAALAVLPLVALVEVGVAVMVGVLLDTIVVRSLLVPALAHQLGDRIWWPGKLARRD